MNKAKWAAVLAVPAIALAGCGTIHAGSAAATSHSAQASAAASEGVTMAKDALATCLPKGTVINQAFLVSLATSKAARDKLAAECGIPKATASYPVTSRDSEPNRAAFAQAVLLSAGNAWMAGHFKTAAGRDEWANQVFPVILQTYRTK